MSLVPGQPSDGGGGAGVDMWFLQGTGDGACNPRLLIGVGEEKRLSWSAGHQGDQTCVYRVEEVLWQTYCYGP